MNSVYHPPKKKPFDPEKHCGNPDRTSAHRRILERLDKSRKRLGNLREGTNDYRVCNELIAALEQSAALYEIDVVPCTKPKGQGTNHLGRGLCRWHCECNGSDEGHGISMRLGPYQLITDVGALAEIGKLLTSGVDVLDLDADMIVMRGILAKRLSMMRDMEINTDDLRDMMRLMEQMGKTAERIHAIRLKSAVSHDAVVILMQRMGEIVKQVVTDPDQLDRILAGWSAMAPVPTDAKLSVIGGRQ